jgi:outer membrane protein OmpA-like peptidoglycan-associated protein
VLVAIFFVDVSNSNAQYAQTDYGNFQSFRPRETLIFADDFSDDLSGSFPKGWCITSPCDEPNLTASKSKYCFVQKNNDTSALVVTTVPAKTLENYIQPFLQKDYLPDSFVLEFDFMLLTEDASCDLFFNYEHSCLVQSFSILNKNGLDFTLENYGYAATSDTNRKYYSYKPLIHHSPDVGKWHHFSIDFNTGIIACYVDEKRILYVPSCGYFPKRFVLTCTNGTGNVKFANVKLEKGSYTSRQVLEDFNKILSEKKLVTHSILFDVNSSHIKPESTEFLNRLAAFLKNHADVKLEIGGYTDSDGNEVSNDLLSQKRAEEVKNQLVKRGANIKQLAAHGYGSRRPISSNSTLEGKANNRRVEFESKK